MTQLFVGLFMLAKIGQMDFFSSYFKTMKLPNFGFLSSYYSVKLEKIPKT
jgi:hypothetical protein